VVDRSAGNAVLDSGNQPGCMYGVLDMEVPKNKAV